jgi:hypothetical protein
MAVKTQPSTAAHVQWPSQNYYFRHPATMPQEPTPRANRPTNERTKQTHTYANTISATNPIFVNEISSSSEEKQAFWNGCYYEKNYTEPTLFGINYNYTFVLNITYLLRSASKAPNIHSCA